MKKQTILLTLIVSAVACTADLARGALLNGDFETNGGTTSQSASPWVFTGSALQVRVQDGNASIQDSDGVGDAVIQFNSGESTPAGTLHQVFSVATGRQVKLTFDLGKFGGAAGGAARLAVDIFDGSGFGGTSLFSATASDSTVSNPLTPAGYVSFEFTFVSLTGIATLRFTDTSTNGGSSFDAILDNVQVAIPEPSTLLLSCVGLIAIAGKRRRRK